MGISGQGSNLKHTEYETQMVGTWLRLDITFRL